jgi:site-specific recombinase XerD
MITLRRAIHADDPPFLLLSDQEVIAEVRLFLKRHLLQGAAATTLRAYAFDLLCFYRFLDVAALSIDAMTPRHALSWLAALQKSELAPRSINRRMITARSLLNAHRRDFGSSVFAAPQAPFYKGRRNSALLGPLRIKVAAPRSLRVKVPSKLKLPLSGDATRALLAKLRSHRDRAIVALMLCSGLRSCEIICLKIHDLDFDDAQLRVQGKGGKDRLLPISPWIIETLTAYITLERPTSTSHSCFLVRKGAHRGVPLSLEGLRKIFRTCRKNNALLAPAHPHRLRHTFCTNLIRQKVPLPVVQRLMGHATIDTTLLYINLSLEDVAAEYHRAVAELTRIDDHEQ